VHAPPPDQPNVPLSHLDPEEKARRAGSFGAIAGHYERYRPGPTPAALDWLLPAHVGSVIDLGAGTGALTRLVLDRADDVVAVEPDDRMRAVLVDAVPGARAVDGTGESIPLPDGCADAVLASSSWHWMDPLPTLREVGRVLVPGGVLGVVWSGPDPDGPFLLQAQEVLARMSGAGAGVDSPSVDGAVTDGELAGLVMGDARRPPSVLDIPAGVPFSPPEHREFVRDVELTADDLIGLLSTLSWIITMEEETRLRVLDVARRLLRDALGIEGEVTADVRFRTDAWMARRVR
jgi:SAM-dependent methyltransferase